MLLKSIKGGLKMIPLKHTKLPKPTKYAEEYKEGLTDHVCKRVHNNLNANKNKKLI
jgi:hypothetical protein